MSQRYSGKSKKDSSTMRKAKLSIKEKVALEEYYLNHKSLFLDLKIILLTLFQLLFPTNVSH